MEDCQGGYRLIYAGILGLPELEDRAWLKPVLERSGHIGSEYAFGTMYI